MSGRVRSFGSKTDPSKACRVGAGGVSSLSPVRAANGPEGPVGPLGVREDVNRPVALCWIFRANRIHEATAKKYTKSLRIDTRGIVRLIYPFFCFLDTTFLLILFLCWKKCLFPWPYFPFFSLYEKKKNLRFGLRSTARSEIMNRMFLVLVLNQSSL